MARVLLPREFERLGAAVIDADRLGHEVLELPEIRRARERRWGGEIFDYVQGESIAGDLAKIVFAPGSQGTRELAHLEELTHPRIRQLAEEQVAELSGRPGRAGDRDGRSAAGRSRLEWILRQNRLC